MLWFQGKGFLDNSILTDLLFVTHWCIQFTFVIKRINNFFVCRKHLPPQRACSCIVDLFTVICIHIFLEDAKRDVNMSKICWRLLHLNIEMNSDGYIDPNIQIHSCISGETDLIWLQHQGQFPGNATNQCSRSGLLI